MNNTKMKKGKFDSLLKCITKVKRGLVQIGKDEDFLFKAFVRKVEKFLNDKQMEEIIDGQQRKIKDYLTQLASIEKFAQSLIRRGTGQGRTKGSQTAKIAVIETFILTEARKFRAVTKKRPTFSRRTDNGEIYGLFVEHVLKAAKKRKLSFLKGGTKIRFSITKNQIAAAVVRLRKDPESSSVFSKEYQPPARVFSSLLNRR